MSRESRLRKRQHKSEVKERKSKGMVPLTVAMFYSSFNNVISRELFKPPRIKHQGQTKSDAELKISKAKEKRERKLATAKFNASMSKENQY